MKDKTPPASQETALLREHLRYAEDRLLDLRNDGEWLNAERKRLLEENESLKAKRERTEAFRDQVYRLVNSLHTLRMSRSWKALRLMQIIRSGLLTRDISRARFFFSWVLKKMRGESVAFTYRPDPLQVLEEMNLSPIPEPEVCSPYIPARPPLIYPEDHKQALFSAAFWFLKRELPLVSVLLPVYNQAHLLAEAVESVLAQDYPNLELVILDDGSEDDIETVLQKYAFHPCVRIYRQTNKKLPHTLTTLHELARGDLITWISSDNVMEPHMLSALAQTLLARPEAVMAYGDSSLIDEHGAPYLKGDYRPHNLDQENREVLRLHREDHYLGAEPDNYINAAFLYRAKTACALGGRYDFRLPGLEDYDFWLRMQKAGPLVHAKNDQPLYRYRVHSNTMSRELFQQEAEIHYERTQLLMETENRRRNWINKRWGVYAHPLLESQEREELRQACGELPVDWITSPGNPGDKILTFLPVQLEEREISTPLCSAVWVSEFTMELVNYTESGITRLGVMVPRGITVSPLARKAREWNPDPNDPLLQRAAGRPMLGCHFPPCAYDLDYERTKEIIKAYPELFFVFLDTPDNFLKVDFHLLLDGLENAAFLGLAHFGTCYQTYAAWNAVWLPPAKVYDQTFDRAMRYAACLSFEAGRWLLSVGHTPFKEEMIPYIFSWDPLSDGSRNITEVANFPPDCDILNRYLRRWSISGRMAELLAYADAALQDMAAPALGRLNDLAAEAATKDNPDFKPQVWHRSLGNSFSGPLVFQVERLGSGGLERMVATLALEFHARGREVAVLCTHEEGSLGSKLHSQGLPVYCAEANSERYCSIVEQIRPVLINTHYSWFGVELASDLKIPIVATIHNMYAWYSGDDWKKEVERSGAVNHFVAVSQLVRQYYLKHMESLFPDQVSVIPNCYDPARLKEDERVSDRGKLNLSSQDFLFLNLASYDGRKNQLGLLTAFDRAAAQDSTIKLVCAGDPANPEYFDLIRKARDDLAAGDRIEIRGHEPAVAPLLNAADSFVLSSYLEGWSLSATEALASGLPLIHTQCGSAYELCGEKGERGLVVKNPGGNPLDMDRDVLYSQILNPEPPNTEELAAALVNVSKKRMYWSSRRKSLAAYCRRSFSVEAFICRYGWLFKEVLSQLLADKKKILRK